jgi:methylmalonyl-CoA mutase
MTAEGDASTLTLDEFGAVTYERWRDAVERDLKGAPFEKKLVTHTYEGMDILPLYTSREWNGAGDPAGLPGFAPFTRGATPTDHVKLGWDIRQEFTEPDCAQLNDAILADLKGGVTSAHIRFDVAARQGISPNAAAAASIAGRDGAMIYSVDDLDRALDGVHLKMIGLSLEAGAAFLPAAAITLALVERRGLDLTEMHTHFNADPLAVMSRDGGIPGGHERAFEQLGELGLWTHKHMPNSRTARVGTAPYHHAGATAAQDLGFSMATAVSYLRVLTSAGLSVDDAAKQLVFNFGVGCNFFLAAAKLRAARRLWDRILDASGSTERDSRMLMHVKPSRRVFTRRDPWVNLLRDTACVFAASVGGAQIVTSFPLDLAIGRPNDFTRRIARNTQLILQEEAHLHRVIDPAGGSWFIESMTDELATRGWSIFQEIERRGGMTEALKTGWVHEQIDSVFKVRLRNVSTRKDAITGVSEFPNLMEEPVEREEPDYDHLRAKASERIDARHVSPELDQLLDKTRAARRGGLINAAVRAAASGATVAQLFDAASRDSTLEEIAPISPHPYAAPFEALRDASDLAAETGVRPKVFLANLGPVAAHTARAGFSRNFFEAGGFEVISSPPMTSGHEAQQAFRDSGANIAVLCSSDELYQTMVWEVAPQLREAGARTVILAGFPGENEPGYREAGVGRFIYIKCDVLQVLTELLQEEGVLA